MVESGQQVANSSQMVIDIGQMAVDIEQNDAETDQRPEDMVKGGKHHPVVDTDQCVKDTSKQAGGRQWPLGDRHKQLDGGCWPPVGVHLQRMVDTGQRLVDTGQQVVDTEQRVTPTIR
jgi:hypothetical protein